MELPVGECGGGEQVVVTVSVVLLLMLVFYDARLPMSVKSRPQAKNQEYSRGMPPAVLPCDACDCLSPPLSALGL